jgi:hypothetical protein
MKFDNLWKDVQENVLQTFGFLQFSKTLQENICNYLGENSENIFFLLLDFILLDKPG